MMGTMGTCTQSFSDSLEKLRAVMCTVMCASNWHSHQGTCTQSFSDSLEKLCKRMGTVTCALNGHVYSHFYYNLNFFARGWVQWLEHQRMHTLSLSDSLEKLYKSQDVTYSGDMHIKGHILCRFHFQTVLKNCVRWRGQWHAHQASCTKSLPDSWNIVQDDGDSDIHAHQLDQGTHIMSLSLSDSVKKIVRDDGDSDTHVMGHVQNRFQTVLKNCVWVCDV